MTQQASSELSPRMRRMLEIVYAVDGVAGARVWQWPAENGMKRIAVAVRHTKRRLLSPSSAGVLEHRGPRPFHMPGLASPPIDEGVDGSSPLRAGPRAIGTFG